MAFERPGSWKEILEKKENARKKIPEALSIQKKNFLIAINKCDEQELNKEDEEFIKQVMDDLNPIGISLIAQGPSYPWYDSEADTFVNTNLEKNALFELNKYLDCARLVFLAYSGTKVSTVSSAAEYVLRHARRFGDTSKTIFLTNDDVINASNQENKGSVSSTPTSLPHSEVHDQNRTTYSRPPQRI